VVFATRTDPGLEPTVVGVKLTVIVQVAPTASGEDVTQLSVAE
jgi:hypothetical protein